MALEDGLLNDPHIAHGKNVLSPDCEEVLTICASVFETALGPDDTFANAGAHSIAIARLAQRLQAVGWRVPVRALLSDYNTARKVAALPRQVECVSDVPEHVAGSITNHADRDEAAAKVLSVSTFTVLQVLFAFLLYLPGFVGFLGVFSFIEFGSFFAAANLYAFIMVGIAMYLFGLLLPFASLPWVMLIKFFLGGHVYKNNITPGAYPKWSKMHLRLWCISRLEKLALPLGATYRSAPLLAFVLRQLGAKVGKNLQCAHDAALSGPLDLLTIENDVAIQTGAYVQTTRWVGHNIHIGPVHLGCGSKIGMRAAVSNDVTVGRGTWVTPFTPILESVGEQEIWEGAPARLTGRCVDLKRTAKTCTYTSPIWLLETYNVLFQIIMDFCLGVLPGALIFWFVTSIIPIGETDLAAAYFKITPLPEIVWYLTLYAFISAWITAVVSSILSCLFIRFTATSPGLYPTMGFKGALLLYRLNKMNQIQGQWTWTITGQYLRALAGVRFSRLGATECDVMFNLVPELATVDSKVFWSNGSFTNILDYGAEHLKLRQIDMPRNFFSGNNCVLEHGHYPANFLLGVSTLGNDVQFRRQMRSRHDAPLTVVGNPPVTFASARFEEENDSLRMPGFPLFLARVLLNDFFSIGILRIVEMLTFSVLYISLQRLSLDPIMSAVGALIIAEVSLVLLCVAVKRVLVGNQWGIDDQTPFWSWKHFAYFFAQDCFFVWCKGPLGLLAGTTLSNPILRWMGCGVGRRTLIAEPLQCSDWNAVNFGDDCIIQGFLQFHTFENMMLKVKRTHIQDGCTVVFGATVMGGATIERDSTLLPLSLVLKEMHMLTDVYEGSPAEPVSASSPVDSIVVILADDTDSGQHGGAGVVRDL